jgi:lysophospholipase L1-like esterase
MATPESATTPVSLAVAGAGWRRRLRSLAPKILALCLSLTLCLGLAELGLRLSGAPPAARPIGDALLGFGTIPNRVETFNFPEYGGMLTMKTNNLGFHDDTDTPIQKPSHTYRVAFVGDSQTAGECANHESFPHEFERLMNQSGSSATHVEVLNAGVGRYSPYQYYVKTSSQIVPLKPDHLIVGIYLGNDFMDLMRPDDRPYLTWQPDGSIRPHRPQFVMLDDPASPPSMLESLRLFGLMRQLAGPTLLYEVRRANLLLHDAAGNRNGLLAAFRYMLEVKQLTDISLGFMTQSLLQQVWFRHFPDTLPVAFRFDRYVMAQFKALCAANGIRLTYLIVPTKLQVEPEEMGPVLAKVAAHDPSMTTAALQGFENRLADELLQAGRDLGVEVLDVRQALIERRAGRRFYNPEEMHLTPAGNRAMALRLYELLNGSIRAR